MNIILTTGNTTSTECSKMSSDERIHWLENLIFTGNKLAGHTTSDGTGTALTYILSPPNDLIVKIAHTDSPNTETPAIDLTIEMPEFGKYIIHVQHINVSKCYVYVII